jgi:hypothetical protein
MKVDRSQSQSCIFGQKNQTRPDFQRLISTCTTLYWLIKLG